MCVNNFSIYHTIDELYLRKYFLSKLANKTFFLFGCFRCTNNVAYSGFTFNFTLQPVIMTK